MSFIPDNGDPLLSHQITVRKFNLHQTLIETIEIYMGFET